MVDGSKPGLLHHYTQQSFAQQGREKSLQMDMPGTKLMYTFIA